MLNAEHEKQIFSQGHQIIGGLDEAGRGPLAGPVVAACVSVKSDFNFDNKLLENIHDSKKLTEKKREELFNIIQNEFDDIGIGSCDNQTIDKINILQASLLAMKKALGAIKNKPNIILIDGKFGLPNYSGLQQPIVKGDEKIFSIMAASILAKVTRDRIMKQYHEQYPQYGFDKHKGYGTKIHMEALNTYGPCPIHRTSFGPVKKALKQK